MCLLSIFRHYCSTMANCFGAVSRDCWLLYLPWYFFVKIWLWQSPWLLPPYRYNYWCLCLTYGRCLARQVGRDIHHECASTWEFDIWCWFIPYKCCKFTNNLQWHLVGACPYQQGPLGSSCCHCKEKYNSGSWFIEQNWICGGKCGWVCSGNNNSQIMQLFDKMKLLSIYWYAISFADVTTFHWPKHETLHRT